MLIRGNSWADAGVSVPAAYGPGAVGRAVGGDDRFGRHSARHGTGVSCRVRQETLRPREPILKKASQRVDSVNHTLEDQLDLEQYGGRTVEGVAVRFIRRMLALAAAIWHNFQTGQAVSRSLTAYDH
ncbi:hypothetical protein ACIOKA_19030 [Streptomyces anulatus]